MLECWRLIDVRLSMASQSGDLPVTSYSWYNLPNGDFPPGIRVELGLHICFISYTQYPTPISSPLCGFLHDTFAPSPPLLCPTVPLGTLFSHALRYPVLTCHSVTCSHVLFGTLFSRALRYPVLSCPSVPCSRVPSVTINSPVSQTEVTSRCFNKDIEFSFWLQ
jgi:hypothetical protein